MKLIEEYYFKLFLFPIFIIASLFILPAFADTIIIEIPEGMSTSNCWDSYSCPFSNPITGREGDTFTFIHLESTASTPYSIVNRCVEGEHPLDCQNVIVDQFLRTIDYGERFPIFLDKAGVYPYQIGLAYRAYGHIIVEPGPWPPTTGPPYSIGNVSLEDGNNDGIFDVGEQVKISADISNRKTDESFVVVFEAGAGLINSRSWITGSMSDVPALDTITASSSFTPTRGGVYDVTVYIMDDRQSGRVRATATTSFEVIGPPPCPLDERVETVEGSSVSFVYDGGTIRAITLDRESSSLLVEADTLCDATLTIAIPKRLIIQEFLVLIDGDESVFEGPFDSGDVNTLLVRTSAGSEKIEIIGSLPSHPDYTVIIPKGTNIPGCEETGTCFDPAVLTIAPGETVEWVNRDTVAHTVTSGTTATPDGIFDSGLIPPGSSFSYTFDFGEYPYLCVVHPWKTGLVKSGEIIVDELIVEITNISLEVDGVTTTSIRPSQTGVVNFTIETNFDFFGTAYVSVVDSAGRALSTNFFSSRFSTGQNDIGLSIFIPPFSSTGTATIYFSVLDAPLPEGFPLTRGVEFPITILEGETDYGGYDEGYDEGYESGYD